MELLTVAHLHQALADCAAMSTVAEKVRPALQLDTLKFETKELQDRLVDLKKAIKEGDGDGVGWSSFFRQLRRNSSLDTITCGIVGVLFKLYVIIHHANK